MASRLLPHLLALAFLSVGCDSKREGAGSSGPKDAAPQKATATAKKPQNAPAPMREAKPIASAKEVEDALAAWVTSQNQGDFTAYEKLYASKFTGIKRVNDRTDQQDRATWMADRKKMFEKPFTVTTSDLSMHFAPALAIVNFEQTWKSDTFQDRGKKQILFVLEEGKLLVSREEMLSSATAEGTRAASFPFEEAALASRTLESFALLLPGPVDIAWAAEHPRYISNERAQRAVSMKALPANLRALLHEKYEVFDSDGKRCEAKPRGFQIMVHVVPHFGIVNHWEDFFAKEEGRPQAVIPPEARALDLWGLTGTYLSTEATPGLTMGLEMESPVECKSPVWGRKVRDGAPAPWLMRDANDDETARIRLAVGSLSIVQGFDAKAREEGAVSKDERWFEGLVKDSTKVLSDRKGTEILYAKAHGPGGCASENPSSIGFVFRVQGDKLVPVKGHVYLEGPLLGAADLDRDGDPELFTGTTIVKHTKDGYEHVVDLSPLYLDCGC